MVGIIGGLVAAALATVPGAVAGTSVNGFVATSSALAGESVGATILALGEGACVGVGALGGGGSAGIAFATLVGPIGWAIVGCNKKDDHNGDSGYTWDCWKPVVRGMSTRPSCGMTLRCLAAVRSAVDMYLGGETSI